ncbi:diguanylate cyclase [Vibrio sp. SCSIO 43136]|uniref:diguanylate cyclase n=1 Tax=Vibrio sp. SCSIO 43136 TaxID=2819101 RepID=UPI002074C12F|nr:diguanylate cyclase [Vibrio sp. SCSIO 43136]USD64695.1 diguanylate cyclase [Vibrio sp. SCSIO 43136]
MQKRILVVEDSRAYQKYLSYQLTHAGFKVVVASTYQETEQILNESTDFMCAVLDYCLPDADNGEVIDLALAHKVRGIVLTGQFDDITREKVVAKGVLDYITKDSNASVSYLLPLLNRLDKNEGHKALVVDDSTMVRKHVKQLLEHQYIETLLARDGQEGLEILKQNPDITLVITDHDMPLKDGIALTREIRQIYDRNQLAILGLSGNNRNNLTAKFLKSGANDFLHKPFNQEEFYCRVQHILDMKDATDELSRIANQDPLTGLWNRRYVFNQPAVDDETLCNIAMVDIDFFKRVNDTYGHDFGDITIQMVASKLKAFFPQDIVARFGGEEFYIQSHQSYGKFLSQIEAVRQNIEASVITAQEHETQITISIGAVCGSSDQDKHGLIQIADERLYKAKDGGRNRLVAD